MATALITGGTGFVGGNLVRRLLSEGHVVALLVRPKHARWRIADLADRVTWHVADLTDRAAVRSAVQVARPEWVFHLAAYGAYSWQTDLSAMIACNVTGTAMLLEATRDCGVRAFIHTGSSSEYGFRDRACAEADCLEPNSPYAVTKAAATMLCRQEARAAARRVITARLYSAYGPWEEPNRLMPTLLLHALERRLPALANPQTARDFVYVDDVCEALIRLVQSPQAADAGIYNIGSGRQQTLSDVVALVRRMFNILEEPRWQSMPSRQWDTGCWQADPRRALADIGWQAHTSLEDGLARMAEWLAADPERRRFYGERIFPAQRNI